MMIALAAFLLGQTGELTAEEFKKLHDQLKPPAQEVWRAIPWKSSLVEAQNQASQEKKLLFIWSMDGNPLGCG
jgi:hypothetical protein